MATGKGRTIPITQITELAQHGGEQVVDGVRHRRQVCIGAAKTWLAGIPAAAKPDRSKIPNLPGFAHAAAITTYPLDVAARLLDAQRAIAVQIAGVLVPRKSS